MLSTKKCKWNKRGEDPSAFNKHKIEREERKKERGERKKENKRERERERRERSKRGEN